MTPVTQLAEMIESLPPDERQRIEEYIVFVAKENTTKTNDQDFRFDWAGGLSEFRGKYSSLELEKKAMEWMSGSSR